MLDNHHCLGIMLPVLGRLNKANPSANASAPIRLPRPGGNQMARDWRRPAAGLSSGLSGAPGWPLLIFSLAVAGSRDRPGGAAVWLGAGLVSGRPAGAPLDSYLTLAEAWV
jgi:hypothetical protein